MKSLFLKVKYLGNNWILLDRLNKNQLYKIEIKKLDVINRVGSHYFDIDVILYDLTNIVVKGTELGILYNYNEFFNDFEIQ